MRSIVVSSSCIYINIEYINVGTYRYTILVLVLLLLYMMIYQWWIALSSIYLSTYIYII